jgi:hypothetical protein
MPDGSTVPYSSSVYVHRTLPEVVGTGKINITIGGTNAVGSVPLYGQTGVMNIDTDYPWTTTEQQSSRSISIKFGSNDATDTWNVPAMNYQAIVTEDAF